MKIKFERGISNNCIREMDIVFTESEKQFIKEVATIIFNNKKTVSIEQETLDSLGYLITNKINNG